MRLITLSRQEEGDWAVRQIWLIRFVSPGLDIMNGDWSESLSGGALENRCATLCTGGQTKKSRFCKTRIKFSQ